MIAFYTACTWQRMYHTTGTFVLFLYNIQSIADILFRFYNYLAVLIWNSNYVQTIALHTKKSLVLGTNTILFLFNDFLEKVKMNESTYRKLNQPAQPSSSWPGYHTKICNKNRCVSVMIKTSNFVFIYSHFKSILQFK